MELTRRKFAKILIAGAAVVFTGVRAGAAGTTPARVIKAARARLFPGKVNALDEADVGKPAKWRG